MRFRTLVIVAATFLSIVAFGQGGPSSRPGRTPDATSQYATYLMNPPPELKKQLKLTAGQETKLKAINAKYDAKMKAAFQPGPGQAHDMSGLKPIFEGRWKALVAVMTPKQTQTLKKWAKAHPYASRPSGRPRD